MKPKLSYKHNILEILNKHIILDYNKENNIYNKENNIFFNFMIILLIILFILFLIYRYIEKKNNNNI